MSEDNYDDGLVHAHAWPTSAASSPREAHPVACVDGARTPSTVTNDDWLFCD